MVLIMLDFFRNVSLRIKLLGMYLAGLTIIGIIGYGFFIFLEIENYKGDKKLFSQQARFFEDKAFKHMKYTINLQNIISNLYINSTKEGMDRQKLINDFISDVAHINDDNYTFALYDNTGRMISSNGRLFIDLTKDNPVNEAKINQIIQATFEGEINSLLTDFDFKGEKQSFFVNSVFYRPLGYYILSVEKNNLVQKNIDSVLAHKKKQVFKSVGLSLLIGLIGSVIVLVILLFYLKSMTTNINNITLSIETLAASGKTESLLKAQNADEIGNMISAFNKYLKKRVSLEQFKQLIEEDENIEDVYCRIFTLINNLGINSFALYDIDENKNKIHFVNNDVCACGEGVENMPCSQDILVNADGCRSKRLAQVVTGDSHYRECPKFLGYADGKRHMCIPMIIGGTAGEVVHVSLDEKNGKEIEKSLPILIEYLKNAAPVIESKKLLKNLRETTLRDPMTGLNNRRFLEEYTEVLVAETKRKNKNLGILMCDLDWFKKVNDEYGHEAGDKVLKFLSEIIKNSVRASDIVIRYGGEEFLIIIKDADDEESVMRVAEKIRTKVETSEMRVTPSVTLTKTISIGVSLFPSDAENFWQAIKYADISLYHAKEIGRNKVVRFTEELWNEAGGEY